ncbi:unnamed protein product [Lathyrus sativus]|nr:unnamed protein product [Lathyrus sativus]
MTTRGEVSTPLTVAKPVQANGAPGIGSESGVFVDAEVGEVVDFVGEEGGGWRLEAAGLGGTEAEAVEGAGEEEEVEEEESGEAEEEEEEGGEKEHDDGFEEEGEEVRVGFVFGIGAMGMVRKRRHGWDWN